MQRVLVHFKMVALILAVTLYNTIQQLFISKRQFAAQPWFNVNQKKKNF